ncbi:MAG: T9SS type A sorting domain-containing protein [Paludibacteraceae bacterium]|nr:T9SS type A sorting domain-containing protein [Paludibacteraceae bacterium]
MKKIILFCFALGLTTGLSAQLKFNHTLNQNDFDDPTVVVNKNFSPSFSDGEVVFDRGGDVTTGKEAYIDVALEGAPLSISFDMILKGGGLFNNNVVLPNAILPMCWLSESSDGVNYTLSRTWRQSLNQVSDEEYKAKNVTLKPETRFVRIGFRATHICRYRNIVVEPLHADLQLNIATRALDFGRMAVNTTDHTDDKTMKINASWRNLKNITVTVDKLDSETAQNMYSVDKTTLGTSEIANGNSALAVTNNPHAPKGEYKVNASTKNGAVVRIHADSPYDNDERIFNIPLSVILCANRRTITWYEGQDTVEVRNGVTLDPATINPTTGGAVVTYRTVTVGNKGTATINGTTLKVSDIPTMGIVDMEAYCNGTGDYADASVKRTFIVMPEHGYLYETSLCEGETIEMGGQTITADGDKTVTITLPTEDKQNDSTIFVIVHTNRKYSGIQTSARVHQDDLPFSWEGLTFYGKGSQTAYLQTANGCDSIVTMTLQVDTSYHVYKQVCKSEFPIEWKEGNDVLYTFTDYGQYTYTFENTTAVASDSSVTWFVIPHDTIYADTAYQTVCFGESYTWKGNTYTETDVYSVSEQGNCEYTTYTLNLTVLPPAIDSTYYKTICYGATYTDNYFNNLTASDIYTKAVPYTTINCDSVVYTLNLTVLPKAIDSTYYRTICYGTTYSDVYFTDLAESGIYTKSVPYAEIDCDSVTYVLNLNVRPQTVDSIYSKTVCAGNTYSDKYFQNLTTAGTYTHNVPFVGLDCDSVIYKLSLSFADQYYEEIYDTICPALLPYIWNGTEYRATGDYDKTFISIGGCDSTVTLHLLVASHNPDMDPSLDNVPASNKYNSWLLMVDMAAIEDSYQLTPSEQDVIWYRVVGDIDSQKDGAVKDDEQVGQGYYYTGDCHLTDVYYALINVPTTATEDRCGATYRTVLLNVQGTAQLMLTPTRTMPSAPMQLFNLDASPSTIRVYNTAGQVVNEYHTAGENVFTMHAANAAGVYMVTVHNDKQKQTLKYMVAE